MLNTEEEQAYWYFRLNGFFLINNFVIHSSENVEHTSDADLLGIRMPFVYEEIGGRPEDWDTRLLGLFNPDAIIGIICQVKGGRTGDLDNLFRREHLEYCLRRFGFPINDTMVDELNQSSVITFQNNIGQVYQIAKILISRDNIRRNERLIRFSLTDIGDFIRERIEKYPLEKYRDRTFFTSMSLQTIIGLQHSNRRH